MNHTGTQTLKTERLLLRRLAMSDAGDMYANWVTDPQVSRFWSWEPHKNIEETRALLAGWIEDYTNPKTYHWLIVHNGDKQAIGYIYLADIDDDAESVSVHYALSRRYWNQGIMTEACEAVLSFAFTVMGAARVHSHCHTDNPVSGRVLAKCGMRYVNTAYKHIPECERVSGEYHYYEITAGEWKRPK